MDAKAVASSIANFSAKFCNELSKQTSVVSSPLSAEYLLALIALGADEPSHSELLTALGFPNKDSIRSGFSSVSSKLRSLKGVTLNVANRVYVKEGPYQLEPGLLKDATNVFDAVIEKMDFSQSAAAANTINQWVEKQTNNKIKDLLSPDCFNDLTRLVLVNALYFKGTWKSQFNPHHTRPEDFHVDANTKVQVPMMFKKDDFKYGESDALGVQLLEMNYEGDQASMVIILPREIEGLNGVLQKLADGYDLMAELDKMFKTKVEVSLPKFKIETEIDLNELLPKIGIKSIFDQSNSGLNNLLSPPEALFVSKAIQKAFIEVNEEGAEAAAATVFQTGFTGPPQPPEPPPKLFRANRPFLAFILADGACAYASITTAFYRDTACLFIAACRAPEVSSNTNTSTPYGAGNIELSFPNVKGNIRSNTSKDSRSSIPHPETVPDIKLTFPENVTFSPDMFK